MKLITTWQCQCGQIWPIEYATRKKKLRCPSCGSVYSVIGLHINGRPMIGLIEGGDENRRIQETKTRV